MAYMTPDAAIFVAGHGGLVGSALMRAFERAGYERVITRTRQQVDLLDAQAVERFFAEERPRFVLLAAAKVGGILANSSYPADFLNENLAIQANVLQAAHRAAVERLLFLGSASIYPRLAPQPIPESALLSGPLEPSNRPYALAKIAGIEMCWALNRQHGTRFLAAMPTNLYGPGDNFDLKSSHVLPALIRKTMEAKQTGAASMTVWGTGTPRREFLHADDLAEACLFLMNLEEAHYGELLSSVDEPPLVNVGVGEDISIGELAALIARVAGYAGRIEFDTTKPDGVPRRLLDVTRIHALGWRHRIALEDGIRTLLTSFSAQSAEK